MPSAGSSFRHAQIAVFAGVALALTAGCAAPIQRLNGFHPVLSQTTVLLHHHKLPLHLSAGDTSKGPLLVYATGDAGWFGKDEEIFNVLVPWGHPVVGFSARDYVHHLDGQKALEPAEIADDYAAIIAAAERALGLPAETRVVLVGKSRGAGLQLVAADAPRLRPFLLGIVGIGLTHEEEFAHVPSGGAGPAGRWTMVTLYDLLPRLDVPVAVIQSTRDQYLPAGQGRELFGPDGPSRRFVPIESSNHNFGGALALMYAELHRDIDWICGPR